MYALTNGKLYLKAIFAMFNLIYYEIVIQFVIESIFLLFNT